MKDERFPQPGKALQQWGDQSGQKRSFRGSVRQAVCSTASSPTCTGGLCHLPTPSRRRLTPTLHVGAGCWMLRLWLQRTDTGRRLGRAAWRQLEEAGALLLAHSGLDTATEISLLGLAWWSRG